MQPRIGGKVQAEPRLKSTGSAPMVPILAIGRNGRRRAGSRGYLEVCSGHLSLPTHPRPVMAEELGLPPTVHSLEP